MSTLSGPWFMWGPARLCKGYKTGSLFLTTHHLVLQGAYIPFMTYSGQLIGLHQNTPQGTKRKGARESWDLPSSWWEGLLPREACGCESKVGTKVGFAGKWIQGRNLRSPGGSILTHTHVINLSRKDPQTTTRRMWVLYLLQAIGVSVFISTSLAKRQCLSPCDVPSKEQTSKAPANSTSAAIKSLQKDRKQRTKSFLSTLVYTPDYHGSSPWPLPTRTTSSIFGVPLELPCSNRRNLQPASPLSRASFRQVRILRLLNTSSLVLGRRLAPDSLALALVAFVVFDYCYFRCARSIHLDPKELPIKKGTHQPYF